MDIDGRYAVVSVLGDGVFGQTYLARELATGAEVVIKRIAIRGLPGWKPVEMFEREVAVLRSVRHAGVPRFLEAFQTSAQTSNDAGETAMVLVVERVPGDSLLALLERGHRWEEGHARGVLERLLEVLGHLHTLSPPVIHRDIKPGNVIIRPDGQPVLVDFGAVRDLATRAGHQSLTVVGTAGYLPPEQAMGAAVPASDIFALGCTMIHLLTHCHPADLPREGLRLVFADRLGCSRALTGVLEQMVEPNLAERYRSAAEALADLRRPPAPAPLSRRVRQAGPPVPARQLAPRPPAPAMLELPPSPRPLTRAARDHIGGVATLRTVWAMAATLGTTVAGWIGMAAVHLSDTAMRAAFGVGVALVAAVGMEVRRRTTEKYQELYRTGAALRGTVQTIKWVTEGDTRYADVRYSYEVRGVTYWGEVHYGDRAASAVHEQMPVLVIHDPHEPSEHIGLLVSG